MAHFADDGNDYETTLAALDLYERGFSIMPLGSPVEDPPARLMADDGPAGAKERWSKTPRMAWRHLQQQPASLDQVESWSAQWPMANWAVLTGKRGRVVVVDADSAEAVRFVEENLTPTPWVAQTGKGRHYYYLFNPDVDLRNSVNVRKKIDIRAEGGYVVAPGSLHFTGVRYQWLTMPGWEADAIDDLPMITRQDVEAINRMNGAEQPTGCGNLLFSVDQVRMPADGAPVPVGGRNDAAASLVGQYIHQGVSLETIKRQLDAWNATNPVPLRQDELNRTIASVVTTATRNNPAAPVPVEDPEPLPALDPQEIDQLAPTPEHLLTPPGILADMVTYYNALSLQYQPELAVMSAIATAAAAMGRRFCTNKDNWPTLYFIAVARSGAGKETVKRSIENMLEEVGAGNLLTGEGYTSPGAVYSSLLRRPAQIAIIDEMGKMWTSAQARGNQQKSDAITELIKLWGRCNGTHRPQVYSTMGATKQQQQQSENLNIRNPALSLVGMSTPGTFYESLRSSSISDGFLGRVLIVESNRPLQVPDFERRQVDVPQRVVSWLQQVLGAVQFDGMPDVPPVPVVVPFTRQAMVMVTEFWVEMESLGRELEKEGRGELVNRCNEIAMRVALICAVSEGSGEVDSTHFKWASDYVRHYMVGRMLPSLRLNQHDNDYDRLRKETYQRILAAGALGMTISELGRVAPLRRVRKKDREDVLNDLVSCEAIEVQTVDCGRKLGRKRSAFVAVGRL